MNCGACAFAVEQRLSGDGSAVASLQNIPTDREMEHATGKKCRYMSPDDIASTLKMMGPESHLIAGINRKHPSGKSIAGHWFNVFYDGEKVYTIDGQSGEIHEFPYDYGFVSEWCVLV